MFAIIHVSFSKKLARKYLLIYVLFEYYDGGQLIWLNNNFVKNV
jgi:hypothetical protein